MTFDADRYYTPAEVAHSVLEKVSLSSTPKVCVDSTCGTGQLLEAAKAVFGASVCVGLDNDRRAIDLLRRKHPNWILSVGNLLNRRSFGASLASRSAELSDLLILNPPFSQHGKKCVEIQFRGDCFRGSVAMFYLLRSFELFAPKHGAVAIVPESLLHSAIDASGRKVLQRLYTMRCVADLEATTFKGARVHATAVHFDLSRRALARPLESPAKQSLEVQLIRGALPVHLATKSRSGLAFLHSTNIRRLVADRDWCHLPRTSVSAKGQVQGWSILLPRVGVPSKCSIAPVLVPGGTQLSDCVIALNCDSRQIAERVSRRIHLRIDEFLKSYRGTAARYITIQRLREVLGALKIDVVL